MHTLYKKLAATASGLTIMLLAAGTVHAQSSSAADAAKKFPERPVTVSIGFAAGGPTDVLIRLLNDNARKALQQPFIAENRPGAAGSVALSQLTKRDPDGYNVGALLIGAVVNQHIRKVDYDSNQLSPIIMFGTMPQGIVVRHDAPWKTIQEFLEHAKSKPGAVRYSTAGIGTAQHFSMERLGGHLDVNWIHVPYKGGLQAIQALLAGEVEAAAQTAEWKPFVQDGRLRLLATFTDKPLADFPNVPTMRDIGLDIRAPSMMGIVGPKGMNPEIVKRLHDAYKPTLDNPEFQKMLETFGLLPSYRNPQEFQAFLEDANAYYAESAAKIQGMIQK